MMSIKTNTKDLSVCLLVYSPQSVKESSVSASYLIGDHVKEHFTQLSQKDNEFVASVCCDPALTVP